MNVNKIFTLSLIASTMLIANEPIKLDEIVTIGTKTQNSVQNLPMQVLVINQEEIKNSGASNVSDILNSEGSIYLKTTGSNGATMSIRGMAHVDTLILIDGKRVNGEFSKTYELDRIPAGMIERIEIVKGSSSLLYGSDAMGGVINIITKKSTKLFEGDVTLTYGKNKNTVDTNVMGTVDKTSYKIYGNYLNRDSFSEKETTDIKVMQSGAETSPSNLAGGGNWASLRNNLDDSYSLYRDYQDEMKLKSFGTSLAHKLNDSITLKADYSYLKEDKNSQYISNMYLSNYVQGGNSIKTKYVPVEQFDDNVRHSYGFGMEYMPVQNLSIDYNFSYSKYEKDRKIYTDLWQELGYATKKDSLSGLNESVIKHTNNDLLLTYNYSANSIITTGAEHRQTDVKSTAYDVDDRVYKGFFIQHEYKPTQNLNLVYGVRYDKDSIGEDETSLSFGTTYHLSDDTKIRANYSEGFRSPDDRELYVDQTSPSGKKMLGATVIDTVAGKTTTWEITPETSKTYEIGFTTAGENWNFDLSAFQTKIKNRITQVAIGNNYNTFENVSDSKIQGIETTVNYALTDTILTKFTYSVFDAKNRTDNIDIAYTPSSLASLTISYFPTDNLELKTITKYTGDQKDDENEKIESYNLTNFKIIYTDAMQNLDLFAGVDNLFSQNIPNQLGAIEKANYYMGLKYKF